MNQLNNMNKLILFFIAIIVITASCDKDSISPVQAEKFIKYYGGAEADHGNDVKQLPGGGYFIAGTVSTGDQTTDIFTLITDEYGNSKTEIRTFDGNHLNDRISRIKLLPDGGAVGVGTYQRSVGNKDIWILRFNSIGDTVWTRKYGKSYGDDEGKDLIINRDGNIVAVGYSDLLNRDGVIEKETWIYGVGIDGDVDWPNEKIQGTTINADDVANSILEVEDGYLMIGSTNAKNSGRKILVAKTNDKGSWIISDTIPRETNDDQGQMISILPDGNIIILGTRTYPVTNTSDILLVKISGAFKNFIPSELEVLDEQILDGGENESACCFLNKDNQLHILGTTVEPKPGGVSKILLIITGESGNDPQFFKYGLKNEPMEGFGLDMTADGGYIFTGSNLTLFKTGKSGDF